jgi:hypothetical protein
MGGTAYRGGHPRHVLASRELPMLTVSRRTVIALAGSIGLTAMLGISSPPLLGSPAAISLPKMASQGLADFVSGNLLFVLCHEIAHAAITQMGLPVLGRQEDAADSFASLRMIRLGSEFSHRVLADAAEGWFLSNRRDQQSGDKINYYDDHGIDLQRAYQIVCFMVGSDKDRFKDLASETKLPEARQDSCAGDYSNASYSWDLLLKPHLRTPDQPKTKIDVVYGEAKGRLEHSAQTARSNRLLETVAQRVADEFVWPAPFTLEMQSCGFPNARWDLSTHKLTLCYELAADFEELYRAYGAAPESALKPANRSKRKSTGLSSWTRPKLK